MSYIMQYTYILKFLYFLLLCLSIIPPPPSSVSASLKWPSCFLNFSQLALDVTVARARTLAHTRGQDMLGRSSSSQVSLLKSLVG